MVDDDKLMAFVDGELTDSERREVERALAAQPELRARVEEQRGLREKLRGHYGPVAAEDVPEKLLAMLHAGRDDGEREGPIASLATARERRRQRSGAWIRNTAAMAATFAVGIVAGQTLLDGGQGSIATEGGMLLAQGTLARSLETQLASTQPANAAHRIGVTFTDRQGDYCRTFEGADLSGLACRKGGNWSVIVAEAGTATALVPEFRQAGSPTIMATAQELMAGAPLDAETERALVEAEWKR